MVLSGMWLWFYQELTVTRRSEGPDEAKHRLSSLDSFSVLLGICGQPPDAPYEYRGDGDVQGPQLNDCYIGSAPRPRVCCCCFACGSRPLRRRSLDIIVAVVGACKSRTAAGAAGAAAAASAGGDISDGILPQEKLQCNGCKHQRGAAAARLLIATQ